jgi:hypothetical protein
MSRQRIPAQRRRSSDNRECFSDLGRVHPVCRLSSLLSVAASSHLPVAPFSGVPATLLGAPQQQSPPWLRGSDCNRARGGSGLAEVFAWREGLPLRPGSCLPLTATECAATAWNGQAPFRVVVLQLFGGTS